MTKIILSLLLCLAITACGGSGGDIPTAPPPVACTPKVVTVQLLGDSTMWGYDSFTGQQAFPSPAQNLQAAMDLRFGLGAVVVKLNAVVGSTSSALVNGTGGYSAYPAGVSADVVVFNYGINDQDPVVGESIAQYEANLRALAKLSPGQVIFETPNATPGDNPRVGMYAQRMRDVAASLGLPVADTFAYVRSVANWETYFNDGAHPGSAMYGLIVANSLAPVVAKAVAPLRCQ